MKVEGGREHLEQRHDLAQVSYIYCAKHSMTVLQDVQRACIATHAGTVTGHYSSFCGWMNGD